MLFYRPQTKFAKVMFSQVSVHTGGGGGGVRACVHGKGGAYVAGETATAAGGTHPTGMRLRHTFCLMLSSHIRTSGQTNIGKLSSQNGLFEYLRMVA